MPDTVKILTVVGARPQFVKAAVLSRAIQRHNTAKNPPRIEETLIHTGQHYDLNMSRLFFEDLGIPEPAVNLQVGSGTHGRTTGDMLAGIEREIQHRKPDVLLVYGDTNSTLAGALAAAKLHVPVAHVEAGLRSFNKAMPEEINRVLTDHIADWLFCPTIHAVENLRREGINHGVHHVGDVMFDAARLFTAVADERSTALQRLKLAPGKFILATVHRAENTDDPERLAAIMTALAHVATEHATVVLPLHPRTRAALKHEKLLNERGRLTIENGERIQLTEPLSFIDMVALEAAARIIITDSGGVQKEAYFHGVPCVTLRKETEWTETVENGWNQLADCDPDQIRNAVEHATPGKPIADYGQGNAADKILKLIH